jgi:hypothetical protein
MLTSTRGSTSNVLNIFTELERTSSGLLGDDKTDFVNLGK